MAKMNILTHINAHDDVAITNNPLMNHVDWTRSIQGIDINEPTSKSINLPAGQSFSLFSGLLSISSDATTTYDIALKSGTSNTYAISHNSGTAPIFRTLRTIGHDATTAVTVTKNAKLAIFTATGGTLFDLVTGLVQIGDEVRIGTVFNAANRGKFKIISFNATSFTIENELAVAEGPIVLGANFAIDLKIHSSDNIQVGDKIDISSGFSSVTFGIFDLTDVSDDSVEFFSSESLPAETGISNNPAAFLIFRDAKQFLYIESDKKLDIKLNGSAVTNQLLTLNTGTVKQPGLFMSTGSIKSAEIVNKSLDTAKVFYITAE